MPIVLSLGNYSYHISNKLGISPNPIVTVLNVLINSVYQTIYSSWYVILGIIRSNDYCCFIIQTINEKMIKHYH